MRVLNQYMSNFRISIVSYAIAAVSIAFIPVFRSSEPGKMHIASYILAGIFWIGLIFGSVFQVISQRQITALLKRLRKPRGFKLQRSIGIVTFHVLPMNITVYVIFAVSLILVLLDCIFSFIPESIVFPSISLAVFTFILHCIIDGRNYNLYKRIKEGVNHGNE